MSLRVNYSTKTGILSTFYWVPTLQGFLAVFLSGGEVY